MKQSLHVFLLFLIFSLCHPWKGWYTITPLAQVPVKDDPNVVPPVIECSDDIPMDSGSQQDLNMIQLPPSSLYVGGTYLLEYLIKQLLNLVTSHPRSKLWAGLSAGLAYLLSVLLTHTISYFLESLGVRFPYN